MLVDLYRPDAIAIALHGLGFGQDLCSQQYLLGLRGLHTEDNAIVFIFR